MERVSLERSDYFEGVLTVLRNGEVIIIDSMEFDSASLANLSDIVNNKRLTQDNQVLNINQLTAPINDGSKLADLQSAYNREGNRISLSNNSQSTPNYKAELKTTITIGDMINVCELKLGNVHFEFNNAVKTIEDDYIEFRNIKAIVLSENNSARIL